MRYNFTDIIDRHGWDSIAVDLPQGMPGFAPAPRLREGFDTIPMWVADMNFAVPSCITDAIISRASHPAFGYFEPRKEYFDAIIRWQEKRNRVDGLTADAIGYENGVLGCVNSALRVLTGPGDPVLVHSPTYIGFTMALSSIGRRIVLSPLKQDAEGVWRMDFDDMRRKIRAEHIRAAVFCSPHNPTGRVWEREEVEQAMEVFRECGVYVISDEIWSDLVLDGREHIPPQSVSEDAKMRTVAAYALSKTFNLAGLVGAYHIVYDPWLRDRLRAEERRTHYNEMNVLSMHALIGAYSADGAAWVDELRTVLRDNIDYACGYIRDRFDGVKTARPQGTYMLFLDTEGWCRRHGKTLDELLQAGWDVGVLWQDGRPFHGEYAVRLNLALPYSRVEEAFARLDRYVF